MRDNIQTPEDSSAASSFRESPTLTPDQTQQGFAYLSPAPQQFTSQPEPTEVDETVQVRIEPFFPVNVPAENIPGSIFPGQVFLIRHIQIAQKHFLQGFMLNETVLFDEIKESVNRLLPDTMKCSVDPQPEFEASYNAILDFGFGQFAVNLFEKSPGWIAKDINKMKTWFFSIISIVLLAVTIALLSIWINARSQLRLARKKDDFISAVSHELRTPLTSIRMYAEMLEKNWVSSEEKLAEYYSSMRQESERLSRLIENVLDFSRIQKGRKKYNFSLGSINDCVGNVVDMMTPYADRHGFTFETQYQDIADSAFDSDAVTQIVVNLIDNAVKYARNAEDKTITIRTYAQGGYTFIEVADKGPGIPRSQVKKVFEQFYRCQAEATRETAGTGLGLALVRKFAQAHNGFVEIVSAKPTGAVFKVALAIQN
jgi:signal transduction histidine kinase